MKGLVANEQSNQLSYAHAKADGQGYGKNAQTGQGDGSKNF